MNPIQGSYGGTGGGFFGGDAFVTKINSAGTALVYSTYLGGSDFDRGLDIAVDSAGSAYVTGAAKSLDFPLMNPIQGVSGGGGDAFITKINPAGSALVYSTYLGGTSGDVARGIAVDNTGVVYVGGETNSLDFPLVAPIQAIFGGGGFDGGDAFVTAIDPSGAAYVYSTYLGGINEDPGKAIAIDGNGAAYIVGRTFSPDFPLMNPIQGTYGGGFMDAFVAKISGTPPPVVTLAVTSDVTSVARSGVLGYTVTATNTTATQQCVDYWETVTLPDGTVYPPTGALFGPFNVCLGAGASKTAHQSHGVPMSAPVGAYVFNAFVGTHPTPITDEAHFNFDVTVLGQATQKPETSWRLIENGFRK